MKYALVNMGNGEGWNAMSFENKKEMLSFCCCYHYQPISAKEAKRHEVKNVTSYGEKDNKRWIW